MLPEPQLTAGQAQTFLLSERVTRILELNRRIAQARQAAHEYAVNPPNLVDLLKQWRLEKLALAEDLEAQRDRLLAVQKEGLC